MSQTQILFVDAHNIFHIWKKQNLLGNGSDPEIKQQLLDLLENYQGYSGTKLIVVFDAYTIPGGVKTEYQNKLEIRYSAEGQSADTLIEKMAGEKVAAGNKVEVATADNLEQLAIFSKGAYRVTPSELWMRVSEHRPSHTQSSLPGAAQTTKNSLFDGVDKETRDALERMRRGK